MTTAAELPAVQAWRGRHLTPAAAMWAAIATAGLLVADLALGAVDHQFWGAGIVPVLILAPFAGVGLLLSRRMPHNPIGWIMLAIPCLYALASDAGLYAVFAFRYGHDVPGARAGIVLAPFSWFALVLLLPLPILLFPDGSLPSRRWRWPLAGYLGIWSIVICSELIVSARAFTETRPVIDGSGELAILEHPPTWYGAVTRIASPLYGAFALAFVSSQVVAFRRSRGERRQQLKWLMVGGVTCVIGAAGTLLLGNSNSKLVEIAGILGFVSMTALPIGIAVGILRYRLYDLDRIISRTLSYTIVTGLLVAVFASVVVLATQVLPFSSPVGVAPSTLSAAALFNPLRRRVQRLVDRRFNRARHDAEAVAAAFSARLREAVDLEAVQSEFLRAVELATEPAAAGLWIRPAS